MPVFKLPCKLGDEGRTVIEIQLRVGTSPTGLFDEITKIAIEAWQTKYGLPVNGALIEQTMFDILTAPLPPDLPEEPVP